tara:strand:+ start:1484 stop:2419 length:936 start_codon:yes stop_codon:yes gene_type:complete
MKNILFIGGSGFLGKNLINLLLKTKEYKIHVLCRTESNFKNFHLIDSKVKIYQANLRECDKIKQILTDQKIDIVMHLSSSLKPNSDIDSFNYECKKVISPTTSLISLCSKLDILFVYFSSGGAVYGNSWNRSHSENDPLRPISYYGLAKYYVEEAIRLENRSSGLRYLILRPSNPFGPGQDLNGSQGLIAVTLEKILSQKKISIWGDGTSIRDYIYIDDLCQYVYKLLNLNCQNETFNLGSGNGSSVKKIIETTSNITNIAPDVEYTNSRSFDVDSSILDVSYLEKHIGELGKTPLEKGISLFADYIKKGD